MNTYNKVMSVYGALNSKFSTSVNIRHIAPAFSPITRYYRDDLVSKDNVIYRCLSGHHGEWDQSHFDVASVNTVLNNKACILDIAPKYISTKSYSDGDVVTMNGFLVEKSGGNWVETSVADIIKKRDAEIETLRQKVSDLESRVSILDPELSSPGSSRRVISRSVEQSALRSIADEWSPEKEYKPGMMVSHDGVLYCCVDDHTSGNSWDGKKWTKCTVAEVIEGLTSAFSDALKSKGKTA